jgi:Tfp pilus assembly protein PilF
MVPPMLWTTAATGLPPDRHGVIDFLDRARNNVPVDAFTRRTPAVWDIAESFSRHSMVVNWWTAWPPTTDDTIYYDAPVQLLPTAVAPEPLAQRAQPLEVPVSTVGYEQVRRFLNISQAEYEAGVQGGPASPVNVLRNVLAKTWSDHRVAMNLYREQTPLLFMLDFEGTDAVNHLFGPYHPPQRDGIGDESYRKYWPAVSNYYAEIDRLLGEWMSILPDDTTVMLVSTHGFRWGKNRPHAMPNGAAALADHRNPGVFVAYGNHVAANRALHALSIYDLTPTILAILGLPQSAEMPGHVATWAFHDITPVESVKVVSYSEFINDRPRSVPAHGDPNLYRAELQAIGHLTDPNRVIAPILETDQPPVAQPLSPERWGAYAYWNNLAIQLRSQNKTKEAIDAFDRAIDINPARPTPYLNEAMLMVDKQMFTAADKRFLEAVEKGLPNADRWFVDFAALYRDRDMPSRSIAVLYKGREMFPQSYEITANLGAQLVAVDHLTEGLPQLERALGLQPSSTMALNNLGLAYSKNNDYARAVDFWNRSLAIDPRQPKIREALNAARTRL